MSERAPSMRGTIVAGVIVITGIPALLIAIGAGLSLIGSLFGGSP